MMSACGVARRGQFLQFVDYEKLNGASVGDKVTINEEDVLLDGTYIKSAEAGIQSNMMTGQDEAVVMVRFTEDGAARFAEITTEYLGRSLAIVSEGVPLSAPVIQSVIANGEVIISGLSDVTAAEELAKKLNGK